MEGASPGGLLLGMDADPGALEIAAQALSRFRDDVQLAESNFRELSSVCERFSFVPVHGVLFDLGVSSMQLADESRGFGFQVEAPLDMRFSPGQTLTAAEIVNQYEEEKLADVIWRVCEEAGSPPCRAALTRSGAG